MNASLQSAPVVNLTFLYASSLSASYAPAILIFILGSSFWTNEDVAPCVEGTCNTRSTDGLSLINSSIFY